MAHPTNEHRNIRTLPAPVSVKFVENEEAQVAGLLDHLRVGCGVPRQHELEHNVVR